MDLQVVKGSLSSSEKKRLRDKIRNKTRINIGECFNEWRKIREDEGFQHDFDVCRHLLDIYYRYKRDYCEKESAPIVQAESWLTDTASEGEDLNYENTEVKYEPIKVEPETPEPERNTVEETAEEDAFQADGNVTKGKKTSNTFQVTIAWRNDEGELEVFENKSKIGERERRNALNVIEKVDGEENESKPASDNDQKSRTVEENSDVESNYFESESSEVEDAQNSSGYSLRRKRRRKFKKRTGWGSDCEDKDQSGQKKKTKKAGSEDEDYMPLDQSLSDLSEASETETSRSSQRETLHKQSTPQQKTRRKRSRQGEKSKLCPVCGVRIMVKRDLEEHMFVEHTEEGAQSEKRHQCDQCNKSYRLFKSLSGHKRTCHVERHCKECGEVCKSTLELKKHKKFAHGHVYVMSKNFACSICGLKFRAQSSRDLHIRSKHLRLKDFKCSWGECGKTFANLWAKTVHERIHTDEKPIVCELCGDRFRQKNSFSYHMKHKHNNTDNKGQ